MPSLIVISGPREGERIDVDRTLVVGRHDADVVIDDPELSRQHVKISLYEDGLIIEDLESTNGTFVDERLIEAPTHVRHGDRVALGATVLEVQIAADAGATQLRATREDLGAMRPGEISPGRPEPAVVPAPSAPSVASASAPALRAPESAQPSPADLPAGMGAFTPPAIGRGRGLASRSWVPVALSFATVILTALALVVYFAQR